MVGDYDWFSPEAIREYFRQLHSRIECFDKPQIQQLLYSSQMYFETAANNFKLIDDNTTSVIVNWGKIVVSLVNKLQAEGCSYHLMKQLSQYSVNIRNRDLKILQDLKAIEEVSENIFFIRDPKFYDEKTGLTVVNNWLEESLII
jgi:CRISPR-associated endonuclease/helicase Cas3